MIAYNRNALSLNYKKYILIYIMWIRINVIGKPMKIITPQALKVGDHSDW